MLPDEDRTKEQLINELAQMRQRIVELEASEAERRQVEAVLRESERKYRTLVEEALVGIVNVDIKGKITYVNETVLQSTGYSREEMVGKNAFRIGLITRETVGVLRRRMKEKLMGKPPGLMQVQFRCKNGEWIWLQIKGKALWEHGMPVGVQIIGENITEPKKAEEALRESEERFRRLFEQSNDAVFIHDLEGKLLDVNSMACNLLGYHKDALLKIPVPTLHPEEELPASKKAFQTVIETGSVRFESKFKKADGTIIDVDISSRLTGPEGGVVQGIVRDITERKRAEEKLRESEEKYRRLYETAPVILYTLDEKAALLDCNKLFQETFGYRKEEMIGKHVYDFETKESRELAPKALKKVAREGTIHGERDFITKDGKIIKVEFDGHIEYDEERNETVIKSAMKDITERRKIEEDFENIFNLSPDMGGIFTTEGRLIKVNRAWERILGYNTEELLKMGWAKLVHPDDVERTNKEVEKQLKGSPVANFVNRYKCKDGSYKTLEWQATFAKEGIVYANARDITERKKGEEALRESEEKFRRLFEQSNDAVFIHDLEGKLLDVNSMACNLLGYQKDALLKIPVPTLHPEEELPASKKAFQTVIEKGSVRFESKFKKADGTIIDVDISSRLTGPEGGVVQGVARDITERKQAGDKIQQQSEFLNNVLDSLAYPFYVIDANDYTIMMANPAAKLGKLSEKSTCYALTHNRDKPCRGVGNVCPLQKVKKTRQPVVVEHIHYDEDGNARNVEVHGYPIFDSEGNVIQVIECCLDITERTQAEEELRESEERYRALVSLGGEVGEAVIMLQDNEQGDGIHTFVSDQWPRITGYSREELLGMSFFDLLHPEDRQDSLGRHKKKMKGESIPGLFELSIIRKDGTEVPIEVTSAYTTYKGGTANVAFIRDITERKKAEEETRNLAKFPSENPNPVMRIAQNGTVLYANKASLPLLGVWGCRVGQLLPDYLLQPVLGVLDSGLHKYIEVECGERTFSLMSSPIVDAGYINLYGRDITEFKRAEAERGELEQKAQLASRLASVGEMAAGVAHEINNPLTGVIGFAQLLMRKNIPDDIKESVKVINDGAQRVADIINRLLTFARQRKPERGYVDINEIIETTLSLRAYEMETANIKVTTRLAPDLPRTMADSGQLQQLFLNIIINAETEMKLAYGRGSLLIKTETIGSSISISFKDDGPGIARKNLGRIFDPFFTTREVGSGTGLGLSLCHGIVAEHNGYIYARSRLGRGATFVVELPIVIEDKQLGLPEPTADEAERVAGAKILVVDDEPAVLQFLEQVLTDEGHEVVTTDRADDALNKIKRGQYNLILLDIKLPGMSGIELYKRIQKVSGSLASRVIFITGDIMGADTRDFFSQTKAHYITKPLDIEQLKREIDSQLYQGA